MIRSHDETTLHDEVTPNDEMNKEMRAKRGCDSTDDDAVVAALMWSWMRCKEDDVVDALGAVDVCELMMVCCFR